MPESSSSGFASSGDWSGVLDRLEHDAGAAAALLAAVSGGGHLGDAPAAWRPPSGLVAVPGDLAGRAAELAARQEQLLGRLAAARASAARQLAALDSIPAAVPSGTAVYLDVEG